jgi:chaperonin cofactor prefoldin
MTDSTIFDDKAQTPPVGTPPIQTPQLPDEVAALIGEGKKYATLADALKSIPHAQSHIATLEAENRAAKERLEKAKAADEVYETVKEMLAQGKTSPSDKQLVLPDMEELLDRKLAAREQAQKAKENTELVKQTLVTQFGDSASEVYKQKAAALGIGVEFLNDLCAKSPAAAFELLGVKPSRTTAPTTSKGTVNTALLDASKNPPAPKTVMGGASTTEVKAAWRAAAPKQD